MSFFGNLFASKDVRLQKKIQDLIATIEGYDDEKREKAAEKLAEIGEAAVEPLILALKEATAEFSSERKLGNLADVFCKIGAPAVKPLAAELAKNEQGAAFVLGAMGAKAAEAVPALIYTMCQGYSIGYARDALGKMGNAALEPIIAILQDKNCSGDDRVAAISALGKIGGRRAKDQLAAALDDADSGVRFAAALMLGRSGDAHAVQPLIAALDDGTGWHRTEAIDALAKIKDEQARKALQAVLDNPSNDEEKIAAEAAMTSLEALTQELVKIGWGKGFIGTPGGDFDEHHNHIRTRHIGELLDQLGGMELMREVHAKVAKQVTRPGAGRELESCWDRIGHWRG